MIYSIVVQFLWIFSSVQSHFIPNESDISTRNYSKDCVIRCYYKDNLYLSRDTILQTLHKYTDFIDIWDSNEKCIDLHLPRSVLSSHSLDKISIDLNMDCETLIENLHTPVMNTLSVVSKVMKDEIETSLLNILDDSSLRTDDNIFNILELEPKLTEYFFQDYRNLDTLQHWYQMLTTLFPNLIILKSIGTTPKGNDLHVLEINSHNRTANPKGKTIVITGGLHSREWISISSVCYIMFQLLNEYVKGENTLLLDSFNFIFAPTLNPDGYEYTWTTDRLWRKNRQDTGNGDCIGYDLDRTFGYKWQPTNEYPCSGNYNGDQKLASVESQLWSKYIEEKFQHNHDEILYGFIDFHSYSQEILYPFTYSCDILPNDIENLLEFSYDLSKIIRKSTGKQYDVIQSCKDRDADIKPSGGSGSLLDYMYNQGALWSYQIKLRDTGNHGFLLPSQYIEPVGQEATIMIKAMCDFLLNPPNWS